MTENKAVSFFLGANTPQGFYSLFDELENKGRPWHSFLIKGGPGTGKSAFLKKTAAEFSSPAMEIFPCSSDPDSLDAVMLPERGISLMDATAPHAKEATVPAVRHTLLNFADHLDGEQLQEHRREIEALTASTPEYYRLAVSYLRAAQAFLQNSFQLADCAVDNRKIEGYARRFAAKNFKALDRIGTEKRRFLTTICGKGLLVLEETPAKLCKKLWLIDDDCGAVAQRLLSALRRYALQAGHDVISCSCPMAPNEKLEHLLIPTAGIGFLTANHFHPMAHSGASRSIHARRFQEQELMNLKKARFLYNRKAAQTLLEQAVSLLEESRQIHDRLEQLYCSAMDFDALNTRYPKMMEQISRYSQA